MKPANNTAIQTIVKVGGSLGRNGCPKEVIQELTRLGPGHGMMVIPGGGEFADAVRACDTRLGLDAQTAHWMAILAMDQYAYMLAAMAKGTCLVRNITEGAQALKQGLLPILLCHELLKKDTILPRTWEMTSDSIALHIAGLTGAGCLILLKSIDGLPASPGHETHDGSLGTGILDQASPQALSRSGLVDPCFPELIKSPDLFSKLDIWIINGQHCNRITRLFQTGKTVGTRVVT